LPNWHDDLRVISLHSFNRVAREEIVPLPGSDRATFSCA
jgi:hypothetical protein